MKKKITFVLAVLLLFVGAVSAQQNIAKFTPTAIYVQTTNSTYGKFPYTYSRTGIGYSTAVGIEHAFTDQISGQMNVGLVAGFGTSALIKPELAVYLFEKVMHGWYTGAFTSFVFTPWGGSMMAIGPQVGYQMYFLDGKLAVDMNFETGVGLVSSSGGTRPSFHMYPGVSAGYAF